MLPEQLQSGRSSLSRESSGVLTAAGETALEVAEGAEVAAEGAAAADHTDTVASGESSATSEPVEERAEEDSSSRGSQSTSDRPVSSNDGNAAVRLDCGPPYPRLLHMLRHPGLKRRILHDIAIPRPGSTVRQLAQELRRRVGALIKGDYLSSHLFYYSWFVTCDTCVLSKWQHAHPLWSTSHRRRRRHPHRRE